ncbi:unnamed protein product [Caenorhabditis auriculariae]|uniref:Uncharacterized protein n=1 Tax=Caenorhabditis auriculariae TaxID=2777116 RepID=A0A8S1GSP1_9PELO|nr:unnamed protein product [Caenorhabditis auriculariae]
MADRLRTTVFADERCYEMGGNEKDAFQAAKLTISTFGNK